MHPLTSLIGLSLLLAFGSVRADRGAKDDAGLLETAKAIRVVQDIRTLADRLAIGHNKEKFLPVEIVVNEFKTNTGVSIDAKTGAYSISPDREIGQYSKGEFRLLNPANLSAITKTREFNIRWPEYYNGSRRSEQTIVFTPYAHSGFSVKALMYPLPDESPITKFPVTYLLPESWIADAIQIPPFERSDIPRLLTSGPGMSSAILAAYYMRETDGTAQIAKLLNSGELYSEAHLLCLLFCRKDSSDLLHAYVKAAKSQDQIHALALGLAAATTGNHRLEPNDFPGTVRAIHAFAKAHTKDSVEIRQLLKWFQHSP